MDALFRDFWSLKHRGPDSSYFQQLGRDAIVGFHRLAIVADDWSANQPYIHEEAGRTIVTLCNGEIYNHEALRREYGIPTGGSDCAVIPHLYLRGLKDLKALQGEFAFLVLEFTAQKRLCRVVAGRDPVGIRPLYFGETAEGMRFASELKGFQSFVGNVGEFPPATICQWDIDPLDGSRRLECDSFATPYGSLSVLGAPDSFHLAAIRQAVVNSVRRRLSEKPMAFLLSGGVDSSLIAAISAKLLGVPIRTFCCGMSEGTDLAFARKVAAHIGSAHTEVFFTPAEGLEAIRDVIRTTETWDTTTVRASVGQYLVSKYVGTHTDCKVVMVGEGPDEVCSSYLFNWYAPGGEALHSAAEEYVRKIHMYDVRRCDRCVSRWGLEARVPLLDPEFIRAYWDVPAEERMATARGMEKWWLRQAFAGTGVLPDEVLWRKKEAFSDGVSSPETSWFRIIQEWVEPLVTEEEKALGPTKEAAYYKKVFLELFGDRENVLPAYWQPKWDSEGKESVGYMDPSARVLGIYGD